MYATIRRYKGVSGDAANELERRSSEVEGLLQEVPGLVTYHLLRTDEGITSVTVCKDRPGVEESNSRVASWIKENMPNILPNPPEILVGEVIVNIPC